MEIAGYTLTYQQLASKQEANARATRAKVDVSRGGSHVTTLYPGKNSYPVEQFTSNEVSIYHDPRNLGDLFTIADQIDPKSQTVFLKVLVKPLDAGTLRRAAKRVIAATTLGAAPSSAGPALR